jgi:hypothetical protein
MQRLINSYCGNVFNFLCSVDRRRTWSPGLSSAHTAIDFAQGATTRALSRIRFANCKLAPDVLALLSIFTTM